MTCQNGVIAIGLLELLGTIAPIHQQIVLSRNRDSMMTSSYHYNDPSSSYPERGDSASRYSGGGYGSNYSSGSHYGGQQFYGGRDGPFLAIFSVLLIVAIWIIVPLMFLGIWKKKPALLIPQMAYNVISMALSLVGTVALFFLQKGPDQDVRNIGLLVVYND